MDALVDLNLSGDWDHIMVVVFCSLENYSNVSYIRQLPNGHVMQIKVQNFLIE